MLNKRTVEKLRKTSREKWENYYHQLRLYSESRCNKWTWRTGNKENLPKGYDPKSIAREAIKRLFNGDWNWDNEKYPEDSPIRFLKSEIKGFISNIGRSEDHKRYASLEQEIIKLNGDRETQVKEVYASETEPGFRPTKVNTPYEELYFKEVYQRIMASISDREDLIKYHEYKHLSGLTISEIAKIMGKNNKQMKSLIKLFVRRTKAIKEEFFGELDNLRQTSKGGLHVVAKKGND